MKTKESRFQVHDELTAPERSLPVLKGALAAGGQLSNFIGVLAGSPAALRAYARFRSELRHGTLSLPTLERIALAVAEHYHSEPGTAMHSRTARQANPQRRAAAPHKRPAAAGAVPQRTAAAARHPVSPPANHRRSR